MKNIYILSPSDRFNYGDMLFTYILKYYLSEAVDNIINCATTESDFSNKGGIPTQKFNQIFEANKDEENYLIIAGGESLFTTWPTILSFIYKDVDLLFKYNKILQKVPIVNKIYSNFIEYYIKKHYPQKTKYPFTIGLEEIPNFKAIIYNSVGSVSLANNKTIIESPICRRILNSSIYVAVRDNGTYAAMNKMNIKSYLFPDTAILMSEVFSDSYLCKMKSEKIPPYPKNSYIFFQINMLSAKGKEREWGKILESVYIDKKKKYILCPIGTALGHSDDKAIKSIAKYMPTDSYHLINNPSIWDIMYLIKNSSLYIGTSLHGAITAMSYSVPMVTHGKKKVEQYINDWGGIFTDIYNVKKAIINQLTFPIIPSPAKQKELALKSIMNINKIIASNENSSNNSNL